MSEVRETERLAPAELVAALAELPDRQRDAVLMVACGRRSCEQAADALSTDAESVRQDLHRALHTLLARLGR